MKALHKSSKITNNQKLLFIILAVALSVIALAPMFIKYAISEAAGQNLVANSITIGGNNESNEYAADPFYATKAYWDEHYQGEKHYLDDYEGGMTLESGDYFINKDTGFVSVEDGVPGLIIKGNVNLYLEKKDLESMPPEIYAYGGDGNQYVSPAPGILVEEGNSLYVQGVGKIYASAGKEWINSDEGIKGEDGEELIVHWKDESHNKMSDVLPGNGGKGGDGTPGTPAGIGSFGGSGGKGAPTTFLDPETYIIKPPGRLDKWWEEIDAHEGKNGISGENGKASNSAGNFLVSGNVAVDAYGGDLNVNINPILQSSYGKTTLYETTFEFAMFAIPGTYSYSCAITSGAGGGNGGFGFIGSAIGSGGSGGSGGGAGGSGATQNSDRSGPYILYIPPWEWKVQAGGGGAGAGSQFVFGGGSNPDEGDYDYAAKDGQNWDPSTATSDYASGGNGVREENFPGENPLNGQLGGSGGKAVSSGDGGKLYSSIDISNINENANDISKFNGKLASLYKVYPKDEIRVYCKGSLSEQENVYKWEVGKEIKPEFDIVHMPTGKLLNEELKGLYDVEYKDYEAPGKASITIKFKGSPSVSSSMIVEDFSNLQAAIMIVNYYLMEKDNCHFENLEKSITKAYDGKEFIAYDPEKFRVSETIEGIDQDITASIPDGGLQVKYYQKINGAYIKIDNPLKTPGEYKVIVQLNYQGWIIDDREVCWFHEESVERIINKKDIEFRIENEDALKTEYGCPLVPIKVTANGLVEHEYIIEIMDYKVECDLSGIFDNPGTYPIEIVPNSHSDTLSNYNVIKTTGWNYEITKKKAKIYPGNLDNPYVKECGTADPVFETTVDGIYDKDMPSASILRSYRINKDDETPGKKEIKSEILGGDDQWKQLYEISYPYNYLIINKILGAKLSINLEDNIHYDGIVNEFPIIKIGFHGEDADKLKFGEHYNFNIYKSDSGEEEKVDFVKDVGKYRIELKVDTSCAPLDIYNLDELQDTKEINIVPKPLIFISRSNVKIYGDPDPILKVMISGLIDGESMSIDDDYTLTRAEGENYGKYDVFVHKSQSSAMWKNYVLSDEETCKASGQFIINKRKVEVIAQEKIYRAEGDLVPDITSQQFMVELLSTSNIAPNETYWDVYENWPTLKWEQTPPNPLTKGHYSIESDFTNVEMNINYTLSNPSKKFITELIVAGQNVAEISLNQEINTKTYDSETVVDFDNMIITFTDKKTGNPIEYDPSKLSVSHWKINVEPYEKLDNAPTDVGYYAYEVWLHRESEDDYDAYKTFTYSILKKDVNISINENSSQYGDSLKEFTLTQDDFAKDSDKLDPSTDCIFTLNTENEVLDAGHYSSSMELTDSGKLKEANYNFNIINGKYYIYPKPASVTLPSASSIYGNQIQLPTPSFEGLIPGYVPGSSDYTVVKSEGNNVGTYDLSLMINIESSLYKNYFLETTFGQYEIKKRSITIDINDKTYSYGDNIKFSTTISDDFAKQDLVQDKDFYPYAKEAGFPNVGDYTIDISLDQTSEKIGNYNVTWTAKKACHINKRIASAHIEEVTVSYGEDKEIPVTFENVIDTDTPKLDETYFVDRERGYAVDDYNVTVSFAEGSSLAKNYTFSGLSGIYHIKPLEITLKPSDVSKVYGEEIIYPTLEIDKELPFGEEFIEGTDYSIEGVPEFDSEKAKVYTTSVKIIEEKNNYTIKKETGNFEVKPAALEVKCLSFYKVYGDQDPQYKCEFRGIQHNDQFELGTDYKFDRVEGEKALNNYSISFIALDTEIWNNYNFWKNTPGSLFIDQKDCEIFVYDANKEYIEPDPIFSADVTGLLEGESFTPYVDYVFKYDKDSAGVHDLYVELLDNDKTRNYYPICWPGTLTIEKFENFDKVDVNNVEGSYEYTGGPIEPKVDVSYTFVKNILSGVNNQNANEVITKDFVEGLDYEVTYDNNINPGTATINIDGIGSCAGHKSVNFEIVGVAPSPGEPEVINTTSNTGDGNWVVFVSLIFILIGSCLVLRKVSK